MIFKRKIPCYVLVYDQLGIIKESLSFLCKFSDRLDIVVIENHSPNSPKIKKYIDELGHQKLIARYYAFEQNITSGALDIVFHEELPLISKSRFVVVTDGDLVVSDKDWLDEEISILKRNRDVYACGVTIDLANLPIADFPDARSWIPPDMGEHKKFIEAYTGGHLLMMRGRDFTNFLKWKNANQKSFVDAIAHQYCYEIIHKKWARTAKAKAYHLTWDLPKKSGYMKKKLSKSFEETWHHNKTASHTLTVY